MFQSQHLLLGKPHFVVAKRWLHGQTKGHSTDSGKGDRLARTPMALLMDTKAKCRKAGSKLELSIKK